MPEEQQGGKKILGMPRRVAIPVLAIAGVVVVYFLVFRRQGSAAVPRMAPEDSGAGGGLFGGGGGGPTLGQIITTPPMNPWEEAMERLGFEREQFQYNIEQRRESERQREADIAFEEKRSALDRFLELLPFQLETERQREEAEAAGFRAEQARAGAEAAFFETERAAQERFGEASRSAPVKCPPGMHPANIPGVGFTCRTLGDPGGGRGFNPIRQVGEVLSGFFRGVASAAPGIGAGAAQYGAAQAGVFSVPGRRQTVGTPPINPSANPYQFTGDPVQQFGLLG